jgi:hypothetical protein
MHRHAHWDHWPLPRLRPSCMLYESLLLLSWFYLPRMIAV